MIKTSRTMDIGYYMNTILLLKTVVLKVHVDHVMSRGRVGADCFSGNFCWNSRGLKEQGVQQFNHCCLRFHVSWKYMLTCYHMQMGHHHPPTPRPVLFVHSLHNGADQILKMWPSVTVLNIGLNLLNCDGKYMQCIVIKEKKMTTAWWCIANNNHGLEESIPLKGFHQWSTQSRRPSWQRRGATECKGLACSWGSHHQRFYCSWSFFIGITVDFIVSTQCKPIHVEISQIIRENSTINVIGQIDWANADL